MSKKEIEKHLCNELSDIIDMSKQIMKKIEELTNKNYELIHFYPSNTIEYNLRAYNDNVLWKAFRGIACSIHILSIIKEQRCEK